MGAIPDMTPFRDYLGMVSEIMALHRTPHVPADDRSSRSEDKIWLFEGSFGICTCHSREPSDAKLVCSFDVLKLLPLLY